MNLSIDQILLVSSLWSTPFQQRASVEIILLAVLGGVLGSWLVLRRLAFYAHSVGAAVFPGLVVAGPWGISAQLGALISAGLFAGGQWQLSRSKRIETEAATGLLLVAAMALGIILASDVYHSRTNVDRLLFGSIIGLSERDLVLTAIVVIAILLLNCIFFRTWLVSAFDSMSARALGIASNIGDFVLLIATAAAIVVSVKAVGALLVASVLIIPAATARLLTRRVVPLQLLAVAIGCVEGLISLYFAQELNISPGPVLSVVGGAVFVFIGLVKRAHRLRWRSINSSDRGSLTVTTGV